MAIPHRWFAVAAALSLSACSTVNPYQRQPELDSDLPGLAGTAMAGSLGDALRDINAQRLAWFEALSDHARVANAASLSVYGITAWGLYQGLKPNFVTGGVASESTRANLAKAGIGAGLAYSIGNLFINDKHDEAYVEGFRALTCLMARARPYLLKQNPELDDLKRQASQLEVAIQVADQEALRLRWANGTSPSARASAAPLAQALQRSESAQRQARLTLERARMLVSRVETVGFQLRRQGDLVVAGVSEELRRNNRGVASPDEFLSKLQAVTGRFQSIAPVEASDDDTDSGDTPAAPAAPAETGSAETPATAGGRAAPAAADKAVAAAAATEQAVTALAAKVEDLKSALLTPEARKEQAFKQLEEQTQRLKKQLDAAEVDLRKLKQAEAARQPVAAPSGDAVAQGAYLASQVSGLYAQRRKVNQYLVNHNDLASRVKNIPECRAGGRPVMVLMPSEDRTVSPGNYRFVISGAKGVPLVSVDGNAGTKTGQRTLVVSIEGATVVVDLLVAENAPAGALRLLVHDPVSRATEDVVLTVQAAKKP